MTKLEEAYEQAKVKHRAAQRALCMADGEKLPDGQLRRLQRAVDDALAERRLAFAAYMEEEGIP